AERIDSAVLFMVAGQSERAAPQIAHNRGAFESELKVEEGNLTEPGEKDEAAELRRRWEDYQAHVGAFAAGPPAETADVYFRELQPRFLALKEIADRILDMNQAAMVRKSEHAQAVARRLEMATLTAAVMALGLGVVTTSRAIALALRHLNVLTHAVRRIGEKDFAAR